MVSVLAQAMQVERAMLKMSLRSLLTSRSALSESMAMMIVFVLSMVSSESALL
jgi:hypothetical protein